MKSNDSPLWTSLQNLPRCPEGSYRYLLINQAAFTDPKACTKALDAFEHCSLLDQPVSACRDGTTPFLIKLDDAANAARYTRTLATLCNEGCYASAISVLDASQTLECMAQAATQRCYAQLPDGSDVLLRYFDTRIMAALTNILDAEQHAGFLSCASTWWFAGREGQMLHATEIPSDQSWPFTSPVKFSLKQVAALTEATLPDGLLDTLIHSNLKLLIETPYPRRYSLIRQLVADARSWGLKARSDLVTYCVVALEAGAGFERSAPWSDLLDRVAKDEIRFADALQIADRMTE